MNKETYVKMVDYLRERKGLTKVITFINRAITVLVFLLYPALLAYLFWNKAPIIYRAIVVPLDSFIILSVFRYLVNRQRPYEKFGVLPVIAKSTKGKSFPSRHVFSGYMIAMTFWFAWPSTWLAIVIFTLSFTMAVIRVISGVHYISDVVAGALFAVAAAIVGFVII